MRWTLVGLVGVAAACTVGDVDYVGKRCTTTCPNDLVCVDGTCQEPAGSDASPPDASGDVEVDAQPVDAGDEGDAGAAVTFAPSIVQGFGASIFGDPLQVGVTSPNAETKGNLNLVAVSWQADGYSSSVLSITDTDNDTYEVALPSANGSQTVPANVVGQTIWYANNIHGGLVPNHITLSTTLAPGSDAGAGDIDVRVLEISGLDPSAPIVATNQTSGHATIITSTSVITPSAALLVAASVLEYGDQFADAGAPFTFVPTPTSAKYGLLEYQIVDAGGTYAATATATGASNFMIQILALH